MSKTGPTIYWYKSILHVRPSVWQANPLDPVRTNLQLYRVLLEQLKSEELVKKQFERVQDDISALFDLRRFEKLEPRLKFSLFDPLRNGAARAIRMQQVWSIRSFTLIVLFIPLLVLTV